MPLYCRRAGLAPAMEARITCATAAASRSAGPPKMDSCGGGDGGRRLVAKGLHPDDFLFLWRTCKRLKRPERELIIVK